MTKYTPAPWLRDGLTIYTLMHAGWRKGVEQFQNRFSATVQGTCHECPKEEAEANARLIAAAPDLLEALKGVVAVADRDTVEFMAARAAIAKAEGS